MRDKLAFVNFTHLSQDLLLEILSHRNAPEIRSQMRNSDPISAEDHLRFCAGLKHSKSKFYFAVFLNDILIGVLDYRLLDAKDRIYESGAYFFDKPSIVRVHAVLAAARVCVHYDLRLCKIAVKKDNIQALLFNTMKLGFEIETEDNDYYYLQQPELNLSSPQCRAKYERTMSELARLYELSYSF